MQVTIGNLIDQLTIVNIRIWMAEDIKRNPQATDEEIANVTSQMRRTVNYATCVLWGRDHIRTFDGLPYDFQGT